MEITELLAFTKKNGASDLHLSSGQAPTLRIDGEVVPLRVKALSKDEVLKMLYSIMTEEQRIIYEEDMEIDFAFFFGNLGRFRVNSFNTINGPAAVMRDIPMKIQTIDELKLSKTLKRIAHLNRGLVLVTGPTGSGKSTTLSAIVDYVNENFSKHILTIEDPVEFVHKSKRSLINQREVGSSTKSFKNALKSALREDPDVILVGELRDIETISLALTAAETGHLVLGTLHTSSAAQTIDRIIDVFPEGDKAMVRTMLASSMEGIISQLLIKRADGEGRVAALEILLANSAVRNLIRDNKIPQIHSILQVSSRHGMCSMDDSIMKLAEKGLITQEVAQSATKQDFGNSQHGKDGSDEIGEF